MIAEKTILTGELHLWSQSFGEPGDPCVLLIAGANASGLMWPDEFVERLCAHGLRVIRFDHRDTGRSTYREFDTNPYSLDDLAADAVAILDGWGVERAHVVGLSMGGTLGQLLALDYPSRLQSLTVMLSAALDVDFVGNIARVFTDEASADGLPLPRREVLEVLARRGQAVDTLEEALARRVDEWRALSGERLPFVAAEFRLWEQRSIVHAGTWCLSANHARAGTVPLERGKALRDVAVPTLVIQGSEDPLNPPPHGRHLAELIPGARLVTIEGMGHALPGCLHQRVAEEIVRHVRAHAS